METTILQQIKNSLTQRLQNTSNFLINATSSTLKMRTGQASEHEIKKEISLLHKAVHKVDDLTIGLCEVCNEYIETARLEMDYTASVCIEHLSNEERTRLENDLELSVKVQQALLPQVLPRIQNIDIAAYSQPARIVGGDYFDFLRFKDDAHAIIIADVMGKGMPASMLMASLQASLRIIAPESKEPSEIVARLNNLFCHNIQLTNFVTLFLAKYDEQTHLLTYCNAGHNPPLVYRKEGDVVALHPTGAAIGLIEQTVFEQNHILLKEGDRLLLYTDGVVESFDQQRNMFEQQQLEEFLKTTGSKSAQQMINDLKNRLQRFRENANPTDDTTFIAMTVNL